jgi:hypothetical protein
LRGFFLTLVKDKVAQAIGDQLPGWLIEQKRLRHMGMAADDQIGSVALQVGA